MTQPILPGNLEILVLKALTVAPMHGYAITDWLEQRAQGTLALADSALYQALYRLEGRRLVKATWGITDNNRRAKIYQLTEKGRTELRAESAKWNEYANAIGVILSTRVSG